MYGEEKRLECWFNSCDIVSLPYLLSSLERDSHGLNSLDFFLQPFRGGIVFSLRAVPSPDTKVTAPLRHLLLLEYLQLSLPEASSSLWFFSFQMWRAWKDLSAGMTFLIEQSCHTINSSTIYSEMLPKVRLCQCWILKLSVSLWVFFLLIASFFFFFIAVWQHSRSCSLNKHVPKQNGFCPTCTVAVHEAELELDKGTVGLKPFSLSIAPAAVTG